MVRACILVFVLACILVFVLASGVIELMELVGSGGGGRSALRPGRNPRALYLGIRVGYPLLVRRGSERTAMTKHRSKPKGRRNFDTALHYNTVDMSVTEKTRTAKPAVRATCLPTAPRGTIASSFPGAVFLAGAASWESCRRAGGTAGLCFVRQLTDTL